MPKKDPREILKGVNAAFDAVDQNKQKERNRQEDDRRNLVLGLGNQIVDVVRPLLEKITSQTKLSRDDLREALKEIKIDSPSMPEVKIPEIRVPKPEVTVNVPPIKAPKVTVQPAQVNFPAEMGTRLLGVDYKNPIPVILTGPDGKPYMAGMFSAGGGGKMSDIIKGMDGNVPRPVLVDEGGRLQVDIITGGGAGTQYDEDAAHTSGDTGTLALVVRQDTPANLSGTDGDYEGLSVSDGLLWTRIRDIQGSAGASLVNPDNRIQVSVDQTGAGTQYTEGDTDTSVTGTAMLAEGGDNDAANDVLRVLQMGGGVSSSALRVVHAVDAVTSVRAVSNSGVDIGDVDVLSMPDQTIAAGEEIDISPNQAGNELSPETIRVEHVTDVGMSAKLLSNSGVDIGDVDILSIAAGNNNIGNVDIVTLPASTNTIEVVGDAAHDAAVAGNPLLQGGEARTSNPTAVASGDVVRSMHDDLGKQITYPYTVRDLINTAYVSLANGTETTLLAATAGSFNDLISVMGANQSDAAVTLDLRMVTAGNVVMSLEIPANSTAGIVPAVPYPQSDTGNNWTIDMGDITGTTVDVTGLFVQNV
jgi:hypothetical protein